MRQSLVLIRDVRPPRAGASVPRLPYAKIARKILGKSYELSIVICDNKLARSLNRTHRKKGYAANVLSFPLDSDEGEIFLNTEAAAQEAQRFDVSFRSRLLLLFVHACLHLNGLKHGKKMNLLEGRFVRQFS